MYDLLRPLLFLMPPEQAHRATFRILDSVLKVPGASRLMGGKEPPREAAVEAMGLHFRSPVGLAAGMDKDAEHVDGLYELGFGFIEVGTLTPRAQPGNDRPRLFRLPADRALINRMGFNNGGVQAAAERLAHRRSGIIIGGNIGKNKDTPNEKALDDYVTCFKALYPVVDYFVVNVSSPNTPGLRALQEKAPLLDILSHLQIMGRELHVHGTNDPRALAKGPKPILLKIAPDLTHEQLDDIVEVVKESGIAGIVATNTTIGREGLRTPTPELEAIGAGGLSGAPLRNRSRDVVVHMRERLPRPFVIIGVGGIDGTDAALAMLEAGADLIQVYTGLVYEGPSLVTRINNAFVRWKHHK